VDGVKDPTIGDWMVSVFVDDADNVHVAGQNSGQPAYYKNGVLALLPNTGNGGTYGMTVSGDDVYVAGYDTAWSPTGAKLWKNGVSVPLEGVNARSVGHAVVVDNTGNTYLAAWSYELFGSSRAPVIWKNGVKHLVTGMQDYCPVNLVIANDGVITATCLNMSPATWGVPQFTAWRVQPDNLTTWTRINTADAEDHLVRVFRDGSDVYMAGYNGDDPYYWKNGQRVALPPRAGASWTRARDVYVHPNGSVYVLGFASQPSGEFTPEVWVDGELISDGRRIPAVTILPGPFCCIFAK